MESSVCIIENNEREILLLRRNFSPDGWCLPGGKFNPIKESAESACIREVQEETGIKLKNIEYLNDSVSVNNIKVHIFLSNSNEAVKLSKEHSHYIWTDKLLPEIPLAGNTKQFFNSYIWDNSLIDFDYILTFKKHKGYNVEQVVKNDPSYILWLQNKDILKFRNSVIKKAKQVLNDDYEERRRSEWKEISRKADIEYRKNNLEKSISTPYGKAVESSGGAYNIIDDEGSYTGKTIFSEGFGSWNECGCN